MKRENAGSWNSGLEKEQILETYYAQLQKSWNFTEHVFGIYKKYWAKKALEGGHLPSTRVEGASYPPVGALRSCGPPGRPLTPILCYMVCFDLEKNQKEAFGMKRSRLEAEPWRNQSRAPAELFCQGNILREGEIVTIVITIDPLIERGSISINIFTSTISSPYPSSSLLFLTERL